MSISKKELVVSIMIAALALISLIVIDHNKPVIKDSGETTNNEDYKYLLDKLFVFIYDFEDYYENNINNVDKLTISILNAKNIESLTVGYDDVVKEATNIFGKNNNINFMEESDGLFTYNKETKEYEVVPMGVTNMSFSSYLIDSVTKDNDKLEIILNVGSVIDVDNKDISKICYDYDFDKLDNEGKCEHIENDIYFVDMDFDYIHYMKDHKNKFSKYKMIFTKEDNNYIYNSTEKVK